MILLEINRREIAQMRGRCALCRLPIGAGSIAVVTYTIHRWGHVLHARAHIACPAHLRVLPRAA